MRHALPVAFALLLAACAFNPYRPYDGTSGYSEVNTAKDRYEIQFDGESDQTQADAKNYALVRAAQIGRQNHFAYFKITDAQATVEKERETVRSSEPDPFYDAGPSRRRHFWQPEQTTVTTHVRKSPEVRLVVDYQNEDCAACLSVDKKLAEAAEQGILK